jgi:excinuclease ABC subunit C
MSSLVETKLKDLPAAPGVYLFKDARKKIVYVGKAAILKNRVRQYFQAARPKDPKTEILVAGIADIDWLTVGSEIEALFLESELIKRYKPKYNVELRDDKHYEYVRVDLKSPHPVVRLVRRPSDDDATYVGPFVQGIRPALRLLRRIFPYDVSVPGSRQSRLSADLGLSPGVEHGRTTPAEYRTNLRRLIRYLNGRPVELEKALERDMKRAARLRDYERAARLRNQLAALKRLRSQMIFGDRELFDLTKDQALDGLKRIAGLSAAPRRIEGYDVSHMSGTNNAASMVVFVDGLPDKRQYRKFRMRLSGNDDFAHMREVLGRRFSGRNLTEWPKPDLILIDGGKGQVGAALAALAERSVGLPVIGLAKRLETIIIPSNPDLQEPSLQAVVLGKDSPVVKLLQRIRDESHRFAVSYHSTLKVRQQRRSILDGIAGVGPKTRQKLLRHFGGKAGLLAASEKEFVVLLGRKLGPAVYRALRQS